MNRLRDKRVLITGASQGLGRQLAIDFASEGASGITIVARNSEALAEVRERVQEVAPDARVLSLPADLGRQEEIERVVATALSEWGGRLDLLVNNASVLGPSPQPALIDYPLDVLRTVYEVNVVAPLAMVQRLAPSLAAGAAVINITSDAAVEGYEGWGGYGSSKAALEQLSQILAAEHPDWRVYWVDPGDMNTRMHQEAFPGEDISDRPDPDTSVPGLLALIDGSMPSGRYRAREVAG